MTKTRNALVVVMLVSAVCAMLAAAAQTPATRATMLAQPAAAVEPAPEPTLPAVNDPPPVVLPAPAQATPTATTTSSTTPVTLPPTTILDSPAAQGPSPTPDAPVAVVVASNACTACTGPAVAAGYRSPATGSCVVTDAHSADGHGLIADPTCMDPTTHLVPEDQWQTPTTTTTAVVPEP